MSTAKVSRQPFGLSGPLAEPSSNIRRRNSRPSPLRTYSEAQARPASSHASLPSPAQSPPSPLRLKSSDRLTDGLVQRSEERRRSGAGAGASSHKAASTKTSGYLPIATAPDARSTIPYAQGDLLDTPPTTPTKDDGDIDMSDILVPPSVEEQLSYYDFSKLDYELERAKVLGTGLWSTVYLAESLSAPNSPGQQSDAADSGAGTPPPTPLKARPSLLAVKVPTRRDAKDIFVKEAQTLTSLQRYQGSEQHLVPFLGLDPRSDSLVFEAVIGGSLENLVGRLKVMTELSRHQELVGVFPGLAEDLISGLEFIHGAGIVHADIKTANVLLDVSHHYSLPHPVLRARYIDFSASFVAGQDSTSNAGGTWDFMAPEQMRILDKELSKPSFASDVWSLGISLLSIIVGGSPYAASCGDDVFMLREAIKTGDPLSFARADPVCRQRMSAAQEFVDCCRLALQKDGARRVTASGWKTWVQNRQADVWALF